MNKENQKKGNREEESIMKIEPPWLHSMIHANFYKTQSPDKSLSKLYFCVDCGGESLSKKEMETEHEGHKIFRPVKNSNHYCYTKDNITSLGSEVLDVSRVRVYSKNSASVYYPKPISDKHYHLKGCDEHCRTCGRPVQTPALYCSILCKLLRNESDLKLATLKSMIEPQNLDLSISGNKNNNENKNEKRKRDAVIQEKKAESMKKVAECSTAEGYNVDGETDKDENVEGNKDEENKVLFKKRSRKVVPRRSSFK